MEADVFGITTFIARSPSSRTLDDDPLEEAAITLFPELQDLVVPLNDLSPPSTVKATTVATSRLFARSKCPDPPDGIVPASSKEGKSKFVTRFQMSDQDNSSSSHAAGPNTSTVNTRFNMSLPTSDTSRLTSATSTLDATDRDDLTSRLDDVTVPSKRTAEVFATITHEDLTVPLNDVTRALQTPLSSQPTSKLDGRQSTPYVRSATGTFPLLSDEVDMDDDDTIELGRGLSPVRTIGRKSSPPVQDYEYDQHGSDVDTASDSSAPTQQAFAFEKNMEVTRTPVLVLKDDTAIDRDEDIDEDDPSKPHAVMIGEDRPDVSDQDDHLSTVIEGAEWEDPFGFAWLQGILQGAYRAICPVEMLIVVQIRNRDPFSLRRRSAHPVDRGRLPLSHSRRRPQEPLLDLPSPTRMKRLPR